MILLWLSVDFGAFLVPIRGGFGLFFDAFVTGLA
jgi:hypothetical protein